MNLFWSQVVFAFLFFLFAMFLFGIGYLIKGKRGIKLGSCGRLRDQEGDCSKGGCSICGEEDDVPKR